MSDFVLRKYSVILPEDQNFENINFSTKISQCNLVYDIMCTLPTFAQALSTKEFLRKKNQDFTVSRTGACRISI